MKRLPLWPSSANKWMTCSGQPRIAAIANGFPKDDTVYSGEGKLAHEWLSCRLKYKRPVIDDFADLPNDQVKILDETVDQIKLYAEVGGFEIHSEEHFTLDFDTHTMNLYVDIVLVNDDRLIVLDYKHGEGVAVNPQDNPQLMLYLWAATVDYPDRRMEVGIIQPRGQGDEWEQVEVRQEDLDVFADDVWIAVNEAYAEDVRYVKGHHCQFCPGVKNPICPAQLHAAIDAVCENDEDGDGTTSWWLLDHLDGLKKVVKGVDAAADVWLKQGKRIPGWVLEEKDGRRTWHEPEEVPAMLAELIGGEEGDYKQNKKVPPITITDASKLAKRKGVDISQLIHRPTTMKRVRGDKQTNAMEAIDV